MKSKLIYSSLITLLFFVPRIYAQIDTSFYLSYFPMHIGDKWQYEITDYNHLFVDTTYYEIYEVLGDTVMPNHKKYFEFDTNVWLWKRYFRIDTTELKVKCYAPYSAPDSELIYFDLHPTGNYQSNGGYTVQVDSGFGSVGLLPYTEKYYSYFWFDGFDYNFTLSQDYGISYWNWWELLGYQGSLIAALIDSIQYGQFVGIKTGEQFINSELMIVNYPNPFNALTTIEYVLPSPGLVELSIYDINGREILVSRRDYKMSGKNEYIWDGNTVSSGIYLIQIKHEQDIAYRKCLLVK